MKKNSFAMKTNGIRWCSSKRWWIFPLRLIFYVCSSARNWVSSMYKGIDQFLLGSSNMDVWSSWTGTLKKHQVTRNDKCLFVLLKKMSFSSSPKVTPTTGVVEQWKKTALQWKPMELGGVPQKDGESSPWDLYSMYVVLQGIGSLPCIRV